MSAAWRDRGVRWLKFNAVGGIGIGVQLAALSLLKSGIGMDYRAATALAVETAVIHNFLWHERFTWRDRVAQNRGARFIKFNLTNGAFSILGNLAVMSILVGFGKLNYMVANAIAIALCSVANFMFSDRFVFRGKEVARSEP